MRKQTFCCLDLLLVTVEFAQSATQYRSTLIGPIVQHDRDLLEAEACDLAALDEFDLRVMLSSVYAVARASSAGPQGTHVFPVP